MAEQTPQDQSQEEMAEQILKTNAEIAAAVQRIGGIPTSFHFMESDGTIELKRGYWSLGYAVMNEVSVYLGPGGLEVYNNHPDLQMVGQNAAFVSMIDNPADLTPEIMAGFGPKAKDVLLEFELWRKPKTHLANTAKALERQFTEIG